MNKTEEIKEFIQKRYEHLVEGIFVLALFLLSISLGMLALLLRK